MASSVSAMHVWLKGRFLVKNKGTIPTAGGGGYHLFTLGSEPVSVLFNEVLQATSKIRSVGIRSHWRFPLADFLCMWGFPLASSGDPHFISDELINSCMIHT